MGPPTRILSNQQIITNPEFLISKGKYFRPFDHNFYDLDPFEPVLPKNGQNDNVSGVLSLQDSCLRTVLPEKGPNPAILEAVSLQNSSLGSVLPKNGQNDNVSEAVSLPDSSVRAILPKNGPNAEISVV